MSRLSRLYSPTYRHPELLSIFRRALALCVLVTCAGLMPAGCSFRTANMPAASSSEPRAQAATPISVVFSAPAIHFQPAPGQHGHNRVRFVDVAARAGLHYHWTIPGHRPCNALQTIGNGCAFLDYNNDGNLDILLVGADHVALYQGDGHGHFNDVSHATGLDTLKGHFLGCAVGDYDNDGFDDLYLSGYQTGVLLHNEGGKFFQDVTQDMGLAPQPWGTSCAFADVDGDGYLDLFVCNYVQFDTHTVQLCNQHGIQTACGPNVYHELHGVLYHNLVGRRFEDVTRLWDVNSTGNDLGVAFADFEGTGNIGFALSNDELGGDLFENKGPSRLKNINISSGTWCDKNGKRHGGMGVDWGDVENDGKLDFIVTTFQNQAKCLYHNEGNGLFTETSDSAGINHATFGNVSWGCKFLDADNDGYLDLLIANGHAQNNIAQIDRRTTYRQPTTFLRNLGSPVAFADASRTAGPDLMRPLAGRGLAAGDFDNDGRMDALVVDSEGAPLLLHNQTSQAGHWIGLRLIGTGKSNRDAYGARVQVTAGNRTLLRYCHADGSYLSSSDPRVHFGLAKATTVASIQIRWPDGKAQKWTHLPVDRYISLKEGS